MCNNQRFFLQLVLLSGGKLSSLWVAWFIDALLLGLLSVIFIVVIIVIADFCPHSDIFLLFLILIAFLVSTIAFCFLVSTFFSRAALAAFVVVIVFALL